MIGDVLTKPPTNEWHQTLRRTIRIQDFDHSQSESVGNRIQLLVVKGYDLKLGLVAVRVSNGCKMSHIVCNYSICEVKRIKN